MIKIGLLGMGTVGSGVYEIINNQNNTFKRNFGQEVEIVKVLVQNVHKKRDIYIPKDILTCDPSDILENPDIDIVIELIGGVETAFQHISTALKNKKHVVTANKAVISNHFTTLSKLSKENNRSLLFEASVGGGIPIIKPLKQAVKINNIKEIKGILNGTTNFILTKMYSDSLSFQDSLDLAYKHGYAEADPTDDVEGYDAARKISILSSIAFNGDINLKDVSCRGIASINPFDIEMFKKLGLVVKLLGVSKIVDDEYFAAVEPVLLNKNSVLSNVDNAFNVVSIKGDIVGDLQFYGEGAGKYPTSNAVISDLLDIIDKDSVPYNFQPNPNIKCSKSNLFQGRYYIRISPNKTQQVSEIIPLLKKDLDSKIYGQKDNLIVITKIISGNDITSIINKLKAKFSNVCYLRIDEDYESSGLMEVALDAID